MIQLPHQLFEVIWSEVFVPPQWREGLIVNLKGDKEEPMGSLHLCILSRCPESP